MSEEKMLTWANYHPEVVEAFGNLTPWPCERITTNLGPCSQPTVAMGPNEELVAEGLRAGTLDDCLAGNPPNRKDTTGFIYHSTDAGLNWAKLCEVPLKHTPPAEYESSSGPDLQGMGFLRDGTLLSIIRLSYRNGSPGVHNETSQSRVWITRSTDRGQNWSEPFELDPSPCEAIGGNKVRFFERADATVLLPMNCTNGFAARAGSAGSDWRDVRKHRQMGLRPPLWPQTRARRALSHSTIPCSVTSPAYVGWTSFARSSRTRRRFRV